MRVKVNQEACIGCGACQAIAPSVFEFNEAKTKYAQSLAEEAQAKYDFIFRAKILDFYGGKELKL